MRVPAFGRGGALAATVVLIAACSSGPAATSPGGGGGSPTGGGGSSAAPAGGGGTDAGKLNACGYLTAAQIQAAVGFAVQAGVMQNTDTQTDCEWSTADGTASVGLTISDFDDVVWQAGSSAGNSSPVSGIGDAAFKGWPHAGDLAIKYKTFEVDVAIIDFQSPAAKVDSETLALAKLVLPQL